MPSPILLIGHGSARYPQAGDILRGHAETLCKSGQAVMPAFLNGAPTVWDALTRHAGPWRCAVPFFMEDGYFTQTAIPRTLGRPDIPVAPPIGLHPAMPGLIHQLALTTCHSLGLATETAAVLLIGHGSASTPGRPLALHRHARDVAADGRFAAVRSACLEEPPFVADTLATLRPHPVLVIGYFANRGGHTLDDVPALIEAERTVRTHDSVASAERTARTHDSVAGMVHACGNITEDPAIADIILDQAGLTQGG